MAASSSSEDTKLKKVLISKDEESDDGEDQIDVGISLMKLNLGPKKKLLVLCLGGLLCHRINRKDDRTPVPVYRYPDAAYGSYKVYRRPHCTDFMKFCLERFEVGIWSSAREWYMNNALDCIMVGLSSKLLFAWDQEECRDSGFKTLENKWKPIFFKELKNIWQNKYRNLPQRVKQYSSANTLLIDNNPYKSLLNPANTAVFPAEYKAYDVNDTALGPNSELRVFLDGLAEAENVPSYVKEHPFGKPAITPNHPLWDFYSKVIRANT